MCVPPVARAKSHAQSHGGSAALAMGKDTELFKAAQSGNNTVLEKAFANHLKRLSGGPSHHGSGLGR